MTRSPFCLHTSFWLHTCWLQTRWLQIGIGSNAASLALTALLAVLLALSIPSIPGSAQGIAVNQEDTEGQSAEEIAAIHGIYLPTDRQLSRGLRQARQRIENSEFAEAVAFLQEVLARDEDFFVSSNIQRKRGKGKQAQVKPDQVPTDQGSSNQSAELVGLKSEVRKLLANLPPQGSAAYELQYAARAQKLLQQALVDGQENAIASIVRTYFHTPAGREAALLLAQQRFDRGNPAGAAMIYRDLLETRKARQELEPQLSLLYAASLTAAGQQPEASEIVQSIRQRDLTTTLVVAGQELTIADRSGQGIASLSPGLGGGLRGAPPETDWTTYSGNASRNAQRPGGPPHMRPRWRARVASHPRLESYLRAQQAVQNHDGRSAIPLPMPLAIGDVVVARTPTKIIAVHWQTGKLIWETRSLEQGELDRLVASLDSINTNSNAAMHNHIVDQRVWHDSLAASLSSDGKRVFAIRNRLPGLSQRQRARGNLQVFRQQMFGRQVLTAQESANRLTAYELASEGKLVWELDGRRSTGDLAGAFFLGAPLAIEGTIYLLAEQKSAIYLLALAPKSGQLLWRQQLLSLERGVRLDANRSRLGAQPSFSDGLLICPTSAGAIVAVDPLTRSLAWAHVYAREDPTLRRNQFFLKRQQQRLGRNQPSQEISNGRWIDGTPRIVDERILVTPRDSNQLQCLDLATGKLLWKMGRGDYEFMGCADSGNVLLVAPHHFHAVRLADGQAAWKAKRRKLPEGVFPSGLGVLSEGLFHLPLSSGRIAAIDVVSGDVQYQPSPANRQPLGNLIFHRGAIVSQSPFSLDKFEQHSVFLNRTEAALVIDEEDTLARRDYGELALAKGNYQLAVESLKPVLKEEPSDLITRELLSEALIHLLKDDFAGHQADLLLAQELAEDPESQSELLRIEAEGLLEARDFVATAAALQRIGSDRITAHSLWESKPGHKIRSDRWTQSRMATLWHQATPAERDTIERMLAPNLETSSDPIVFQSLLRQKNWLAFFDGHPRSSAVRIAIASRLIEHHDFLPAEMVLLGLDHRLDHRLDRSLEPDLQVEAAALWEELRAHDTIASQKLSVSAGNLSTAWATRRVKSLATPISTPSANQHAARRSGAFRPLRIESARREEMRDNRVLSTRRGKRFYMAPDNNELRLRIDSGEDMLRVDLKGIHSATLARGHNAEAIYGEQLGSLLFLNIGLEVVAINLRGDDRNGLGSVLWRSSQLRTDSGLPVSGRYGPDRGPYYYTSPRRRLVNERGTICCSLGPVTPRGIVFQDRHSLRCVDPLTGDLLWSRADLQNVCELFGDDQRIYASSSESSEVLVFDMTDGSSLDTVPLPHGYWLATAGSKLAVTYVDATKQVCVRIHDLSTQENVLEERYVAGTKIQILEPGTLSIMEPEGRFQLIDIPSARVIVDYLLPPSEPVVAHHVIRDKSSLFLFTQHSNAPSQNQYQPIVSGSSSHMMFTGSIHALDLSATNAGSGQPLWPVPATIRNQGLLLDQPADSPVLVFVCRQIGRDAGRSRNALRMLCLDKVSGRSVYRSDSRKKTLDGHARIFVEQGSHPSVRIRTLAEEIRLSLSDEVIPPEPPSQFVVEDHKEPSSSLIELGRKVGKELMDAFEESNPFNQALRGLTDPAPRIGEEANNEEAQP